MHFDTENFDYTKYDKINLFKVFIYQPEFRFELEYDLNASINANRNFQFGNKPFSLLSFKIVLFYYDSV